MEATIKAVNDNQESKTVSIDVEFNNGRSVITKTYNYSAGNLESKEQVLKMIQGELGVVTGFQAVVDDLKAEIDKPIEAIAVDAAVDVKNG